MCQIEYDKNVVYMSNTMPDRMPEYMSWNVIGGIIWSKVIPFYIVWYLFISWYIFLYFLSSFKVQFFLILNVFDFWTNKTMLYLTPCGLQHYLVLLMKYFPFHLPWGLVGFFQWLLFPIKLMSDCFPAIFWCIF